MRAKQIQDNLETSISVANGRRLAFAIAAALGALVAAVIAAVGPARGEHAVYSWPPDVLPRSTPERGWYRGTHTQPCSASLVIDLPCGIRPLHDGRATTIFATARHPERTDGFQLALRGKVLGVEVGRSEIARMQWPASVPASVGSARRSAYDWRFVLPVA